MFPGMLDPDMLRAMFAAMLSEPGARSELEKGIADWFRSQGWHRVTIDGAIQEKPEPHYAYIAWDSPEVIAYNLLELFQKHVTTV